MLSELEEDIKMYEDNEISAIEAKHVDKCYEDIDPINPMIVDNPIDPGHICSLLVAEHEKSKFKCNIGSTTVGKGIYITDDDTVQTEDETSIESTNSDIESPSEMSDEDLDPSDEEMLDEYFTCSSAYAEKPKGITPEKLSKVWKNRLGISKENIKSYKPTLC